MYDEKSGSQISFLSFQCMNLEGVKVSTQWMGAPKMALLSLAPFVLQTPRCSIDTINGYIEVGLCIGKNLPIRITIWKIFSYTPTLSVYVFALIWVGFCR